MGQDLPIARSMLPKITAAALHDPLSSPDLVLKESGQIKIIYAPFDHIETAARLVIVGITPGMTQALNALRAAASCLEQGESIENSLMVAKLTASFSGRVIRNNLVSMLDSIGVAAHFGLGSTAELFRPGSTDVHFTSALRYPVFVDGENYNGTPDMIRTPILREQIETHLMEEARALPKAIWLPLGPKAESAVSHLVRNGAIEGNRVLSGLPHPAGQNGERVAVFLGRKRPEDASKKTNPAPLLAAHTRLSAQINNLTGEAA